MLSILCFSISWLLHDCKTGECHANTLSFIEFFSLLRVHCRTRRLSRAFPNERSLKEASDMRDAENIICWKEGESKFCLKSSSHVSGLARNNNTTWKTGDISYVSSRVSSLSWQQIHAIWLRQDPSLQSNEVLHSLLPFVFTSLLTLHLPLKGYFSRLVRLIRLLAPTDKQFTVLPSYLGSATCLCHSEKDILYDDSMSYIPRKGILSINSWHDVDSRSWCCFSFRIEDDLPSLLLDFCRIYDQSCWWRDSCIKLWWLRGRPFLIIIQALRSVCWRRPWLW